MPAPSLQRFLPIALALLGLNAASILHASEASDSTGLDFFEKRIRPLLAESCLDCHGEKKQKGGLRLDFRDGWAQGGDSGPALVPGQPGASLLLRAVHYENPKLQMPPKRKLSAAAIADLERWIAQGAPDPREGTLAGKARSGLSLEEGRKFWSFRPIHRSAPPTVQDHAWPRSDIDRFLRAAQEGAGLAPAPDADRAALFRRLHFTLTGLPPSPEALSAFLTSSHPDAFERAVDDLLASPRFGERWGRHWLDVARFAESSGGGRTLLFKDAWRYRDYVIESFNADVPFDRFLREQIAGDLLPASSPEEQTRQLVATAFLALGPTNYEEQDKKQLRFDIIDEQIDTVGKAFLGLTLGCARCHDHKFDPVPTADYYALAGIFASTRTLHNLTDNVARWVDTPLPLPGDQATALAACEREAAALEEALRQAKSALERLARQNALLPDTSPGSPVPAERFPGILIDDSAAEAVGEWKVSQYSPSYIGEGYRQDLNAGKGEKTLTFIPSIPASGRYEVRLAYSSLENRATNVPVTVFHAEGEDLVLVNQRQPPAIGGRFASLGQYRFEKDGAGFVLVSNEGTDGHVLADAVQFLPVEALERERLAENASGEDLRQADLRREIGRMEADMKRLRATLDRRPVTMSVRDQEGSEIADTAIRVRGLVHNSGPVVPRGFLQVALTGAEAPIPPDQSGRRELADWIAHPDHPLTARVWANRVWHWLFGSGLVRTTDNFGVTGEAPSHPELLDDLAARLLDSGWSTKRLIREIVLSRSWQISSQPHPDALARDPDNRLLTHFPRRRLDAEQLRDAILAVSGQLDPRLGGPNITGAGGIDANTTAAQNTEYGYVFADTRRSVYTPAFRVRRLELFEAFDFGNINQPLGQRNVSTVAPQALYLLNHPFVIEQAAHAATRLLASPGCCDEERFVHACRLALGRAPTPRESALARQYLAADASRNPREAWAGVFQSLFGTLDFRYLD